MKKGWGIEALRLMLIVLGVAGTSGAVAAIIDPGSTLSAISVIAVTVFVLVVGWRIFKLGDPRAATTSADRSRQLAHTSGPAGAE